MSEMYDEKSYELAEYFIDNESELFKTKIVIDKAKKELAKRIQDAVEDYIYEVENTKRRI